MSSINELNWDELNHSYQPSNLSFRTTEEVKSIHELLGQDDAIETIRQGLKIESKGYNLYICGVQNDEIEKAIIDEVRRVAIKKEKPKAVGYIHNFSKPQEPMVIELDTDDALELKQDLDELRAFLLNDIPMLLESDEVVKKQEQVIEEYEKLSERHYMELAEKAENYHIEIRKTEEGIRFAPYNDENVHYSKEDFLELPSELQEEIGNHIRILQEELDKVLIFLERKEKYYAKLYNEVGQEIVLIEVGKSIKRLQEKFGASSILQRYFNGIAEEILSNLVLFSTNLDDLIEEKEGSSLNLKQERERVAKNFMVNWLEVPMNDGAPVICDKEEGQTKLFGNILIDVDNSMMQSHFSNIMPGLINKAHGGYIILHIDQLIEKGNSWSQLKNVLRSGKMYIEGNESIGLALVNPIRPNPVPIDVKVLLIGNDEAYEVLKAYDEDFSKLFKVKVDFERQMDMKEYSVERLAGKIKELSKKEKIKPATKEALLRILGYGYRSMEHPNKISSDFEWIMDLLREAQHNGKEQIEEEDIERCIWRRESYKRRIKKQMDESLQDGTYLIDVRGKRVGQINGLAVYAIGEVSFGRPVRITATTYRGKQGIIDIENEAKLSGSIHTKGIHIITGFLGNQFAQNNPLSLNCQICFEQSYVGIDGDSASSAELYAILSSLSEVPICQNIAVTGSVNQFGEIQPVGGINEKIEGFYHVCKQRGLAGNEGVMIPKKNVKELLLNKEVIEAVKENKFHIYAITDIWEGVELMMQENRDMVKRRVMEKLTRFDH